MTNAAPWLKAMENGGLGEARAKAFLMDRFWVLERSVDVEGADYLVQRRLTAQNFMDREPPRLGVVQVKFIQDGDTAISIHKSYVCDPDGKPYGEFFLLVFSGREDQERSFLLSSTEILRDFTESADGDRTLLKMRGAKILDTSNYEILQKRHALDRIEHALKNASFMANRRFLSMNSYVQISPDHIDADLIKPLDNGYGNIQEIFFEQKQKLQSVLYDIEDVVEAMQKMLRATDPEEVLFLYEDVIAQHVGGAYGRDTVYFSCDFFSDEDFFNTVKNHRARLQKLRYLGVEGNYFNLLNTFEDAVTSKLTNSSFDLDSKSIRVKITYDPATLKNVAVDVQLSHLKELKPRVASSSLGEQTVIGGLDHLLHELEEFVGTDPESRMRYIKERMWRIRRPFQSALDTLLLGEDLTAF